MEEHKIEDQEHQQLISIYEHSVDDIERTKQWQWRFTYYGILAQWGIYAALIKYQEGHQGGDIIRLKYYLSGFLSDPCRKLWFRLAFTVVP